MQNLRRFPIVKLSDPIFIASCSKRPHAGNILSRCQDTDLHTVLVLANHYVWFRHFSAPSGYAPPRSASKGYRRYPGDSPFEPYPSFTEIASFFGLCVWLVPFSLFVSLSASENVLPSMGSEYATGQDNSFARSKSSDQVNTLGTAMSSSKSRQGMAKALVDTVRHSIGSISELTGLQRAGSSKANHAF